MWSASVNNASTAPLKALTNIFFSNAELSSLFAASTMALPSDAAARGSAATSPSSPPGSVLSLKAFNAAASFAWRPAFKEGKLRGSPNSCLYVLSGTKMSYVNTWSFQPTPSVNGMPCWPQYRVPRPMICFRSVLLSIGSRMWAYLTSKRSMPSLFLLSTTMMRAYLPSVLSTLFTPSGLLLKMSFIHLIISGVILVVFPPRCLNMLPLMSMPTVPPTSASEPSGRFTFTVWRRRTSSASALWWFSNMGFQSRVVRADTTDLARDPTTLLMTPEYT